MKKTPKTLYVSSGWRKPLYAAACFSALLPTNVGAESIFWNNTPAQEEQTTQPDSIGALLQEDSFANVVQPISASAAVSPTLLPLTERFELSKNAVQYRNWPLAELLLPTLEHTGEHEWSLYGKALMLSQKGQFQDAYNALTDFSKWPESPFYTVAHQLKNTLALRLAEKSQQNSSFAQAAEWLKQVSEEFSDDNDRRHFNRLIKAQNIAQFEEYKIAHQREFTRPLRVSLLLPMSGPLAPIGNSMLKAAQIALFDHSPKALLLYPQDTAGTADGARLAMDKALRDRTDVIIGPILGSNVNAVSYIAETKSTPMIAFSSDRKVAGPNTFLMNYMPAEQARLAAQHIIKLGHKRIAAFTPQDAYGNEVFNAFVDELQKQNIELVIHGQFDPNSNDHTKGLEKLVQIEESRKLLNEQKKELQAEYNMLGSAMDDEKLQLLKELEKAKPQPIIDFDALFIPASGEAMPLIASQLAYYDIDSKNVLLMGTAQWHNPKVLQNRAEYLRGSQFVAPAIDSINQFNSRYQETYSETAHTLAPLAYDAVMTVSSLFKEDPSNTHTIKQKLSRNEGFSGITGAFRFAKNGIPERLYNIMHVNSRRFKTIEVAPKVMPPALPENVDPRDERRLFNFW